MASSTALFFMVSSILVSVLPLIFSFIMTSSFIRKRTVGTLYMYIAFSAIALAELLYSVSNWVGGLTTTHTNVVYWLQAFFVNLYGLGIIYFYLFSTRNILKDNEVLRSIISASIPSLAR